MPSNAETTPQDTPLAEESSPSSPLPLVGLLTISTSQWSGPAPAMLCRYPVPPDLGLLVGISIHYNGNYDIKQVLRYELCPFCLNLHLSLFLFAFISQSSTSRVSALKERIFT
jgi:hypothetical protein